MKRTWELAFSDNTNRPRHPVAAKPQQGIFLSWGRDETAGNLFTAFTLPDPTPARIKPAVPSAEQRSPDAGDASSSASTSAPSSNPTPGNGRRMLALREKLARAWSAIIDEATESGTDKR